jgi:4-amino-4-deoxy-L-arabinose transferase-like glycosyltransferase
LAAFLREPPLALEILLWLLLAGAIAAMRIYTWQLLPAYLWTRDSGSYSSSAYHWLDTGHMIFDGRRGPVYTTLIAIAVKVFGTMNGVVWLQHALGGLAILAIVLTARVCWGRVAVWPLFACGACLASYGLVLQLGHLIRNETVLFVLSAATLCSWWLALKGNSRGWLFVSALTLGIMILAKSVFAPFPIILLGGVFFLEGHATREKLIRAALLLAGLAVPFVVLKIHNLTAHHVAPPQPQAGILFYGRTAQWTKLDGGIEPELKAKIQDEVLAYQALPRLDNNIVIKRTIVPHLARELHAQGKNDVDLDRLCRLLAIEAVENHPAAWWQQIKQDILTLHIHDGVKDEFPSADEIDHAIRDLQHREEAEPPHPVMQFDQTIATLQSHEDMDAYKLLRRLQTRSILFQFYPVLLTTVALCILVVCTRGQEREFFGGIAILWFANILLLSTVGRPVERYLMPLVPIMFWAMSGVLIVIWRALLGRKEEHVELPTSNAEKV